MLTPQRPTVLEAAPASHEAPAPTRWVATGPTTALLTLAGILVVGQMYVVLPLFTAMGRSFSTVPGGMTWLATGFGFAYALGFLVAGPASDRFGARRVMLVGLFATAATTAAVALAGNLATAIALRVVQGLTASTFAPAAFSYVSTRIAPERRTVSLTCVTSGFLAAAVLLQVGAQSASAALGWRSVFLICGPLLVLVALFAARVLQPGDANKSSSMSAAFAAMPRLLLRPRLLGLYLATATLLGGFVALYAAVSLGGPSSVRSNATALFTLRASALPAMVLVPLLSPFVNRVPQALRLVGGLATAALAAFVASACGDRLGALEAALLVLVAGIAVAAPALVSVIGAAGAEARGAAVALYACFMFIGASLGPQLADSLISAGFSRVVQTVAVVFVAGAVLSALAVRGAGRAAERATGRG